MFSAETNGVIRKALSHKQKNREIILSVDTDFTCFEFVVILLGKNHVSS